MAFLRGVSSLSIVCFLLISRTTLGAPTPDPTPTEPPEEPLYDQLTRAVVRIEEHQSICTPGLDSAVEQNLVIGSGFFLRHQTTQSSHFFLVTARHVPEGHADLFASVQKGPKSRELAILNLPRRGWVVHPMRLPQEYFPVDVAVMRITVAPFMKAFLYCGSPDDCGKDEKGQPQANQLVAPPPVMERVVFFGFPVGDTGVASVEPFARGGLVAYTAPNPDMRMGDKLFASDAVYVVDGTSFPGNSGGPVLHEPQLFQPGILLWGLVTGTSPLGRNYAVVTRPERIRETIDYAESQNAVEVEIDGWRPEPPHLPRNCASTVKK